MIHFQVCCCANDSLEFLFAFNFRCSDSDACPSPNFLDGVSGGAEEETLENRSETPRDVNRCRSFILYSTSNAALH